MSKGTEAISILQSYFGERVDPGKALALMMGKISQQNELIGRLKDLCCAMAFDHGTLEGVAAEVSLYEQLLCCDLDALLALPRCELRAEVVEANQPPSRIIT